MIIKFRDNSLKSQSHGVVESSEISDLKGEINELRKIIEHHPEVTRFGYENLQLREKLYKYRRIEGKINNLRLQLHDTNNTNSCLLIGFLSSKRPREKSKKNKEEPEDQDESVASSESVNMQTIEQSNQNDQKLNQELNDLRTNQIIRKKIWKLKKKIVLNYRI